MAEQPDDPRPAAPGLPRQPPPPDQEWRRRAACLGRDPDLFFVDEELDEESYMEKVNAAKAVCNGTAFTAPCPVRIDCLAYALENTIKFGVWGGWGEYERKRMRTAAGSGKAAAALLREAARNEAGDTDR